MVSLAPRAPHHLRHGPNPATPILLYPLGHSHPNQFWILQYFFKYFCLFDYFKIIKIFKLTNFCIWSRISIPWEVPKSWSRYLWDNTFYFSELRRSNFGSIVDLLLILFLEILLFSMIILSIKIIIFVGWMMIVASSSSSSSIMNSSSSYWWRWCIEGSGLLRDWWLIMHS